ncbi:MAG: 2,3-bisphosphoglycerate-independent phosphoglycerate mutase [Calditrichaeota bacterium]|nr:MAG: 2,3-bisphosphoglycerate-independent phosphoglycerate mutase [Calditrichota bacterium]
MKPELLQELIVRNDSKIIFLILDGLGGHPLTPGGKTELETARTPNFDRYATEGICGLLDPVEPGITPGSGPGHLALFGYDPLEFIIGRGVLSALGIDFELTGKDVAARLNFCTLDAQGRVADRRAGRIPTETNRRLCQKIRENVRLSDGIEFFIETESEHRAVLILRGEGLGGNISDTDPQQTGVPPREPEAADEASRRTVKYVQEFLSRVRELLKDEHPANFVLARGFARFEPLPTMEERYGLKAAAIAQYPMYRGLARLVGMEVLPKPETFEAMWQQLQENYSAYDFFFIHFKKTDSYGEDGNFEAKVKEIERIDDWAGQLRQLNPTVLVITGDHSTPSWLKSHSWHPVPVLLWSPNCRPDGVSTFGESACLGGAIGRMPTRHLIMLALANALRLKKFGA